MGETPRINDDGGEIYLLDFSVVEIKEGGCVELPEGVNIYCRVKIEPRFVGNEHHDFNGVIVLDLSVDCRLIGVLLTRHKSLCCLILTPTISVDDLIAYNSQIREFLEESRIDSSQVGQFEFTILVEQQYVEWLQSLISSSTRS